MDYADVLLLASWNHAPAPGILDAARRLRERGLVRHFALWTHDRPLAPKLAAAGDIDILRGRYNAIHHGAERDLSRLPPRATGPGVVFFTATSWRQLLSPSKAPAGDRVLTTADCYRFVMTNSAVDICRAGPEERGAVSGGSWRRSTAVSWMRMSWSGWSAWEKQNTADKETINR